MVVLTGGSSKFFAQVRRLAVTLPLLSDLTQPPATSRQQQTRLMTERVTQLVMDYEAGCDMNTLAHTYGIHRHTVRAHLAKASVEIRR